MKITTREDSVALKRDLDYNCQESNVHGVNTDMCHNIFKIALLITH